MNNYRRHTLSPVMHACMRSKLLWRVQVTRAAAPTPSLGCRAQQRRVHSGESSSKAPPPAKATGGADKLERLSKVLQAAGIASRRGADALIAQNRVGIITSMSSQSEKRILNADEGE